MPLGFFLSYAERKCQKKKKLISAVTYIRNIGIFPESGLDI